MIKACNTEPDKIIITLNITYRIRSIRRRGYYLFHRPILCGVYSRAAFIDISELDPRPQTTPTFSMHTVGVETERNRILSLTSSLGRRQIRGERKFLITANCIRASQATPHSQYYYCAHVLLE